MLYDRGTLNKNGDIMDYQRTQDLNEQDDFTTQHQANRDDALKMFKDTAELVKQSIEHFIVEGRQNDSIVNVNYVQKVAKGLNTLEGLANYVYQDPEDDNNYFEYNFTEEINVIKKELGIEVEV